MSTQQFDDELDNSGAAVRTTAHFERLMHRLGRRHKSWDRRSAQGTDLLSRIPTGNEGHVIGLMNLGDRILIALSQLRPAA